MNLLSQVMPPTSRYESTLARLFQGHIHIINLAHFTQRTQDTYDAQGTHGAQGTYGTHGAYGTQETYGAFGSQGGCQSSDNALPLLDVLQWSGLLLPVHHWFTTHPPAAR